MSKFFQLALKYFITVAITYGVFMLLRDIITDRQITFSGVSMRILIFSFAMTIVLVSFHRYKLKEVAESYGVKNYSIEASQKRKLIATISPQEVYDNLEMRDYYSKLAFDKTTGSFDIKTGFTGKSWGDRIVITTEEQGGNYIYSICSKPVFPLTIIDFGQNLENTLLLEHRIKNFARHRASLA